jgi:anti-anti-sigma regulatory factor
MTRLTADWTAAGLGAPVVLRLAGHLDVPSVPMLNDALIRCLADEPDLVVLDFTAVSSVNRDGTTALPSLADRARAWPGASLVLAGASGEVGAVLSDVVRLPVYPTVLAALARADGGGQAGSRVRLALEPSTSAAATARRLIDKVCLEWNLLTLRDTARLIVTELVSNAVRHAATAIQVTVSHTDDAIHIGVRDHSTAPARRGDPVPPTVEGGRGLLVVDLMSRAWGTTPTHDGKAVWATLSSAFVT